MSRKWPRYHVRNRGGIGRCPNRCETFVGSWPNPAMATVYRHRPLSSESDRQAVSNISHRSRFASRQVAVLTLIHPGFLPERYG